MKLSARARYATRILLELASNQGSGPLTASSLSRRTGVSTQFIEQILKPLKRAGITASVRGALGGHVLVPEPHTITLGQIVRVMEGGINLTLCSAKGAASCQRYEQCLTRDAWSALSHKLEDSMDGISLADLLGGKPAPDCEGAELL